MRYNIKVFYFRDVQGVGRGGIPIAGTAGYCVGALNIPGNF